MPSSVTQSSETINEDAAIIEELVAALEALHGAEPEKVQHILQLATKLKNNMFPNQPNSQQLGKQPNNQQESQQVIREPIPNESCIRDYDKINPLEILLNLLLKEDWQYVSEMGQLEN